jgi:hypothetical protein
MANRIKYRIGYIFKVPLPDVGGFLIGRILKKSKAAILLEIFRTEIYYEVNEINYDLLKKHKPLLITWCYDSAVKGGMWEISGHEEVLDLPEILFWTRDLNGGYCLIRCTDNASGEATGIFINEDERNNYFRNGIVDDVRLVFMLTELQSSKISIIERT